MKYLPLAALLPASLLGLSMDFNDYNVEFGLEASYDVRADGVWGGWDPGATSWDFSDYTSTDSAWVEVVNPSGQPGSSSFGEAEYCEIMSIPEYDTVYSYFTPSGFGAMGSVEQYGVYTTYEGIGVTAEFSSVRDVFVFPMEVGSAWSADFEWDVELWPFSYHFHETHDVELVGEGIVKVPASGEDWWECLVMRDHFTHVDDFGTDEDRWIYVWLVPSGFDGAGFPSTNGVFVISGYNDCTPEFTDYEVALAMRRTTANPDPWQSLVRSTWGAIKASYTGRDGRGRS